MQTLNSLTKIVSIIYMFIGTPLICLYFDRAISTLLSSSGSSRLLNKVHIGAAIIILFLISVAIDILEQNDDDTVLFNFLLFT